MKQLKTNFEGTGEVKDYTFSQLLKNDKGYIYEVQCTDTGNIHYEVFKHKENNQFNCISYPTSKGFGLWAWTSNTLERGKEILSNF